MNLHLNVVTRPWTEVGLRVLVFVITVIIVVVAVLAGCGLPGAITMAAGACWVASVVTCRSPGQLASGNPL